MAVFYADSSALVKRYLAEVGTTWIQALLDPRAGHETYAAHITHTELIAAITRRARGGTVSRTDAIRACADVRSDFDSRYHPVAITRLRIEEASALAERYGLRGYDAVQLAAALAVNAVYLRNGFPPITLLSADNELNAASISEGLFVDNPNTHP